MFSVICFMGPDGSGKTTLAKRLRKELMLKGYRVDYVWFRFPRFLTFMVLFLAKYLGFTQYLGRDKSRVALHNFGSQPFRTLYPMAVLADTLAFYLSKIWIRSKLGHVVICDRFIFDIIIDLAVETNNSKFHRTFFGCILYKMASKAGITFLVDAPDETLDNRRPEVRLDPYTNIRRSLFRYFAKMCNLKVIDTREGINSVYEKFENSYFDKVRKEFNKEEVKSYAGVKNPLLKFLFKNRYAIMISNWIFQGMLKAVWCERVFRLSTDIFIMLIFGMIFSRFMPLSLLIGFLVGHTFNWLFNGNFLSTLKFSGFKYDAQKSAKFIEWMSDALKGNLGRNLKGAFFIGSIARDQLRETSDIDIRIVRLPSIVGCLRANTIALYLRAAAFIRFVPLDLLIVNSLDHLKKEVRSDEQPIAIVVDHLD